MSNTVSYFIAFAAGDYNGRRHKAARDEGAGGQEETRIYNVMALVKFTDLLYGRYHFLLFWWPVRFGYYICLHVPRQI